MAKKIILSDVRSKGMRAEAERYVGYLRRGDPVELALAELQNGDFFLTAAPGRGTAGDTLRALDVPVQLVKGICECSPEPIMGQVQMITDFIGRAVRWSLWKREVVIYGRHSQHETVEDVDTGGFLLTVPSGRTREGILATVDRWSRTEKTVGSAAVVA